MVRVLSTPYHAFFCHHIENIHAIVFSVGDTAQQQKYKQRADAISAKQ
jgi:hypothetical protein